MARKTRGKENNQPQERRKVELSAMELTALGGSKSQPREVGSPRGEGGGAPQEARKEGSSGQPAQEGRHKLVS